MPCEDEHHGHGHDHGGHDDHSSHGHSHVAPIPTNESQSLLSKIDTIHLSALNLANPQSDLSKLFRPVDEKFKLKPAIRTDADSQLILHIPFINSLVKLYSVILRTNGDQYCPKTIKLFKNDTHIDFDNVDSKKAAFQLNHPHHGVMYNDEELPEELINSDEFVEHFLPRHTFTGVQHLTIFIEDAWGDEDESVLHYIELRGEFSELNRDPVIALYESAANPADHVNLATAESALNRIGN